MTLFSDTSSGANCYRLYYRAQDVDFDTEQLRL